MRKRNIWKRIVIAVVMLSLVLSNPSPALFMGTVYAVQEIPETDILENSDNTGASTDVNSNTLDTTPSAVEEGMLDTTPSAAEEDTLDTTTSTDETNTNDAAAEDGLISDVTGNDNGAEDEEDPEELPKEEEQPSQPEGSLESRDELANASMDQAAAGMWPANISMVAPFSLENDPELISDETESQWKFNVYYVNEDDFRNVTKTEDFSLKYQMEFRALSDINEGKAQIKIPRALLQNRKDEAVNPADVGVPRVEANNLKDALDGKKESRSSSFNYYIETEGKKEYLVFFNYKDIPAGTNAAWQVLYRNVNVMQIRDLTGNELQATISVDGVSPQKQPEPLKIKVDTNITLNGVTKTQYRDPNLSHTPELYTKEQVSRYIGGSLPEKYEKDFDKYIYAVWEVNASGSANQPWNLYVEDIPYLAPEGISLEDIQNNEGNQKLIGEVVGYQNISTQYPVSFVKGEDGRTMIRKPADISGEKDWKKWELEFRVVTAYPKDTFEECKKINNNTKVANSITLEMAGSDHDEKDNPKRESQTKSGSDSFKYKNYVWEYKGDELKISKEKQEALTGWLKLYEIAGEESKTGYGKLSFTTESSFRGYDMTYPKDFERKYMKGSAYELTTVDDLMYAHMSAPTSLKDGETPIEGTVLLGKDDYYYNSVTVRQKDIGYDVWEDKEVKPKIESGDVDRAVYIYAMYGKGTETDKWVLVKKINWEPGKDTMTYTFSETEIAKEPYRVKVVHKATDYRTECTITKQAVIKKDSKIANIIDAYNKSGLQDQGKELQIDLEEISGIWGTHYLNDKAIAEFFYQDPSKEILNSSVNGKYGLDYDTYYIESLSGDSNAIYENTSKLDEGTKTIRPYRQTQKKALTGLVGKAEAFKTSSSINDPENQRILVDYSLTAYDGYEIYSVEAANELKRTTLGKELTPGRKEVVFYDLLPYGMQFERSYPVTAGRITDLKNENYKTTPRLWNTSQVTVGADNIKITQNWRETGRTMVEIHVLYEGADAAVYSSNGLWAEGWGLSFRAYYDWRNQEIIQKESNICAFMPNASKDTKPLCGANSQVACDNGELPSSMSGTLRETYSALLKKDPKNEKGGIDGIAANYTIPQVLFAGNTAGSDGYAGSTEVQVTKRIYAEEGQIYPEKSATVKPGSTYLYEIAVDVATGTLTDMVIFDRLENASEDLAGNSNYIFADKKWKGTFQSVVTAGMEKMGITPEVYYQIGDLGDGEISMLENAAKENESGYAKEFLKTADETFMSGLEEGTFEGWKDKTGWVTKEHYESFPDYELSKVKAVAVVLKNAEGDSYTLDGSKDGKSVTLQIRMHAPTMTELNEQVGSEVTDASEYYTYNNTYYYANFTSSSPEDSAGNGVKLEQSAPVKANLAPYGSLEVIKRTAGVVPSSAKNTAFRFRLYWDDTDTSGNPIKGGRSAGKKAYTLWKMTMKDDGGVEWVERKDRLYETDASGYFFLRADEKAVFTENLPEVETIHVEEVASLFWKPEIPDTPTLVDGKYQMTVTNTYRSVLFVEKKLEGVPETAQEEAKADQFVFRVKVWKKGETEGKLLSSVPFYYMDGASSTGKIQKTATIGEDGTFDLRAGEVAAVFLDADAAKYCVTEVGVREKGEGAEKAIVSLENSAWVCAEPENSTSGNVKTGENRAAVTNYYRYKDLYLTKTLENQEDPFAHQEAFTFQLFKVVSRDGKEEEVPVGGYDWELLDKEGKPVQGKSGTAIQGTVKEDGTFTCFAGGRVVRVKGLPLEAGKTDTTYVVREVWPDDSKEKSKYEPVQDVAEFTLHGMNDTASAEIINCYKYYPLTVGKVVLPPSAEDENSSKLLESYTEKEFTMKVTIDGKVLENHPYVLKNSDGTEVKPSEGGEYKTDEEGTLKLKHGQTAYLKDAGMVGQIYGVSELQDKDFPQVLAVGESAPTGQWGPVSEGEFARGTTAQITIVNGGSDYLMLRKEYRAVNQLGEEALAWVRGKNPPGSQYPVSFGTNFTNGADFYWGTQIYLQVTDKAGRTYQWPESGGQEISLLEPDGTIISDERVKWYAKGCEIPNPWGDTSDIADGSFLLPFETAVLIPKSAFENIESYTLTESALDQSKVGNMDAGLGSASNKTIWVQVTQQAGDVSSKTLAENPVATLHNDVEGFKLEGTLVKKAMTYGSKEVPTGAKLVWRLEQYQNGTWVPASGVKYFAGSCFTHTSITEPPYGENTVSQEYVKMGETIQETDENGRIVLEKRESSPLFKEDLSNEYEKIILSPELPMVWFLNTEVSLNLYEGDARITEGVYRLVEASEDSEYAQSWGRLAGYQVTPKGIIKYLLFDEPDVSGGGGPRRVAAAVPAGAGARMNQNTDKLMSFLSECVKLNDNVPSKVFINSNDSTYVDIEKQMEDSSGERFTMILKHVVSVEPPSKPEEVDYPKVKASVPAGGIPYKLYYTDGTPVDQEQHYTTEKGEFFLSPGQYARLELQTFTYWTVEESAPSGYKKPGLSVIQAKKPTAQDATTNPSEEKKTIWLSEDGTQICIYAMSKDKMLDELINLKR